MKTILEEALNHVVEIRTQSGQHDFRDDGQLVAFDDQWLKVVKSNGEVIFFAIAQVRLVKIVD